MSSKQFNVVLIRTLYPKNIGSVARVCANMDAQLIMVGRKAEITLETHQGAASSQQYLEERLEYKSLEEFYKEHASGIKVAFSRRMGKKMKSQLLPDLCQELQEFNHENIFPIYLIFGPEDHGLSLEDMANVNKVAELPTFSGYGSLNLSHATLLALYIMRENFSSLEKIEEEPENQLTFPSLPLQTLLQKLGYDIETKKINIYSTIKKMILRSYPSDKEYKALGKILNQINRKVNENSEFRN